MAGTLQVDNISNSAGTGAPTFPNGANFSTSQVLQVDTITNAAGTGAPNFTHGATLSTSQVLQADTIANAAGTGAPNFTHGATLSTSQVLQADTISNAAGTGAPNFTHGLNTSTGQVITVDTINNSTSNGGVAIEGIAGNTAASTGYIGEYIESTISGVNFGSTTAMTQLGSITIGAGDWDISGVLYILSGAGNSTVTSGTNIFCIGTTTASTSGTTAGLNSMQFQIPTSGITFAATAPLFTGAIPSFRVLTTGSTTYYFNASVSYSSNVPNATGSISARRRR